MREESLLSGIVGTPEELLPGQGLGAGGGRAMGCVIFEWITKVAVDIELVHGDQRPAAVASARAAQSPVPGRHGDGVVRMLCHDVWAC